MKIRLVSVPHTGTRFAQELLEQAYPNLICEHWLRYRGVVPAAFDCDLVIVPMRNPLDVYRGFWKRSKMGPEYFDSWTTLQEAYDYSPVLMRFLPVDLHDRDDYLQALATDLGIRLRTDWEPVGTRESVFEPPIDLSKVYRLPVVQQFYGLRNEPLAEKRQAVG